VVGDELANTKGSAARVLNCIAHLPVRMISCGGSKNNISLLVNSEYKKQVLMALNEHIFNIKSTN
jgi:aspartate kinase